MSEKVKKLKKLKKRKDFATPYTVRDAVMQGNAMTKLSMLIMGLGNLAHGQVIKGILFLITQISYFFYMMTVGMNSLSQLVTLGDNAGGKEWDEAQGIFVYTKGDESVVLLLFGVATIFVTLGFIVMWVMAVRSAFKAECLKREGKHINSFKDDIKSLFDQNLYKLLLFFPLAGILTFTILPLVFMISMAFTNYGKIGDHLTLFDWVGLDNFVKVLNFGDSIGREFWSVLGWTIVWAIFATFTNYFAGMILAIIINRKDTIGKGFWRFGFILSVAVPQFVTLLIMRTMLQPNGAINVLLQQVGILDPGQFLPFLTDTTWARVTVIVINLWVGVPFTMLQVTGILQNIPAELYESARVDGANAVVTFFKITLPYMFFITTPYLITTFTGNINNFNVIFLLSGGAPTPVGATAGKTDLLVTWLYKLTIDQNHYSLGAVIGIMTFIVLAILSLVTYRNTGSYKDEEGFQ